MILHEIVATNVGPFVGPPVVAGPFGPGLNILAAPNETGKSTLLKAAGRALFDRHTCKARDIELLQPIGTGFAPVVRVDFETAEGRFRVEKKFLQAARSQLDAFVDGRWQGVAEGDGADDRLFALLRATKPPTGAAKQTAHWGMLGYLWMRQGELAEWPEWKTDAGKSVQGMLVKVEIDPFIEGVRSRLWAAYTENFTETTGKPRVGGALLAAEETLAKVDEELAGIARIRQEMQADEAAFASLAEDLPRLEAECAEREREAGALREEANRAALLEVEVNGRRHVFDTAQERLRSIRQDADALERLTREQEALAQKLVTAEGESQRLQIAAHPATERLCATESAQALHAGALAAVQEALGRAGRLGKHRRLMESVARRTALLERGQAEAAAIERLTVQRGEIPAVTPAQCKRLEASAESIRTQRARVEALGLTIELLSTAGGGVTVRVDDQAATPVPPGAAGEARTVRALGGVTLDLSGWGTVRVRSGAGEARALGETLAAAEETLRRELADRGARNVEEVLDFLERGQEVDAHLKGARQALAAVLGGEDGVETLRAGVANERRQWQALAAELRPTPEESSASGTDLEAAEQRLDVQCAGLQAEGKTLAERVQEARQAADAASREREHAERAVLTVRLQAENARRQATALQARYAAGLQAARDAAEEAFVGAKISLRQAREKLPPDAATLPERNRRAAAAAEQVRGEVVRQRDALAVLRGRLEQLGTQALYPRETALLAQRDTLLTQATQARARSRAARLVHDLIERRKQAATRSVLAPLQARLGARFAEVSGERDRQIFLDESLRVRGLGRRDGELVDFAELSQGAKEQLLLCLRLAVAEELAAAGQGPQSLVLDDVLVNTDAARQRRVLDLLHHAAAGGLQILVCTCHPDRYRGVGDVVELRRG